MGKIVLLDDLTINQIAAGEVIERPASVIKELVENSIDAGAKNITIDIKNGGISYIRVVDDGSGIMPDDMEIAFERHATSKIRKASDLDEVKSMGFRGEALASIAAIAKVSLVSKTRDSEIGYEVDAVGGDITDKHEQGAQNGTSITVKELFFNTPVRYKFLKKDFTESGYIEDVVTRIALANPDVAIKLINSGKTVIQTTGNGDLKDCIYNIYGKEIYENVLPVDYTYEDYHVTGVVGKPLISRSNRSNQLFFVNKRFVKDKTLTSAAEQGFKGLVMIGKHGFLILNIDMDPKKVDVNVHPTKLEVRFQEEQKVFKAVYHAIKETLLKSNLISDPVKDYKDETPNDILKEVKNKDRIKAWGIVDKTNNLGKLEETIENNAKENLSNEVNEPKNEESNEADSNNDDELEQKSALSKSELDAINSNDILKDVDVVLTDKIDDTKENTINNSDVNSVDLTIKNENENGIVSEAEGKENENADVNETENVKQENPDFSNTEDLSKEEKEKNDESTFEEMYKKLFGRDISEAKKEYDEKIKEEDEEYKNIQPISDNEISLFEKENSNMPAYKFVGIAFKTYIIFTINDDMYIMDQHAAHERIMYEKVKANYYNDTDKNSQLMLLPDIIDLSNKEMGIFRDNKEMFNKAGFSVEEFGDNTVKLTGVPDFCMDLDTQEIFLETLDEINTVARTAKQEIEDKFLATVACKAAVKAHMALTKEEVDSLMEQLFKLPNPFSCPHGRPTVIKMSRTDIEKKFHRR